MSKTSKLWRIINETETETCWAYGIRKEYTVVAPRDYLPTAVFAKLRGMDADRVSQLATQGYFEVSATTNGTIKLGSYRFIHKRAKLKKHLQTPKPSKTRNYKGTIEVQL